MTASAGSGSGVSRRIQSPQAVVVQRAEGRVPEGEEGRSRPGWCRSAAGRRPPTRRPRPTSGAAGSSPPSTTGIMSSPASSSPATTWPNSAAARPARQPAPAPGPARVSGTPRWAASCSARGGRLVGGVGVGRPALHDGPVEQAPGRGRGQQGRHAHPAGRLAEEGDVARVAPEARRCGRAPSGGRPPGRPGPSCRSPSTARPSSQVWPGSAEAGWARNPSSPSR